MFYAEGFGFSMRGTFEGRKQIVDVGFGEEFGGFGLGVETVFVGSEFGLEGLETKGHKCLPDGIFGVGGLLKSGVVVFQGLEVGLANKMIRRKRLESGGDGFQVFGFLGIGSAGDIGGTFGQDLLVEVGSHGFEERPKAEDGGIAILVACIQQSLRKGLLLF